MKKLLLSILLVGLMSGCRLAQEEAAPVDTKEALSEYYLRGVAVTFDHEEPDINQMIENNEGTYFFIERSENEEGTPYTHFHTKGNFRSEDTNIHIEDKTINDQDIQAIFIENTLNFYYNRNAESIAKPYLIYEHAETKELKAEAASGVYLDTYSAEMSMNYNQQHDIEGIVVDEVDFTLTFKAADPLEAVTVRIMDEDEQLVEERILDLDNPEPIHLEKDQYALIIESYENKVERFIIEDNTYHAFKVFKSQNFADFVTFQFIFE